MFRRWLTFGLSAEQEDRFRQTGFAVDIAQARICILVVLAAMAAFAVNDYRFFGPTWPFAGLTALRIALLFYTVLLLKRLQGLTNYRSYDRAEFLWGLSTALFTVLITATRPHDFVAHVIVSVVAVYMTLLAIPNRFGNQLIVSLVLTVGETLVVAPGLPQTASITALLSMYAADAVAVAVASQLHSWRRREFLAREAGRKAEAEAERQLAERRRAEEALLENRSRMETLFAAIPYVILEYDANLRPVRANAAALKAADVSSLDFTRDIAVGTLKFANLDGSAVKTENLPTSRAMRGETVADDLYAITTTDGAERVVSTYAVPLYKDGRISGVVALWHDITSLKRAEDALRRSRGDLDRAQEVGQIGSWRLDVRCNVLTWSDQNYRIFGVPKGTPLTYETFLGFCHPDDRPYVDAGWKAGLRGEPFDFEHRIVAGGQVKWVREKAYLEFDDSGELLGGFGITQDITERKLAEEQIHGYIEDLRRVNEELTRFNRAAVGRELRMIELKEEVNALSTRLGLPPRYPSKAGKEQA